jgi:glycosyltransferase involved in cell wall biosynthesis
LIGAADFPMKLSVVIPIYNEAATVAELISRVQAVDISKEIIAVDDGSTDGTADVLARLEGQYKNLRTFIEPKNRGKGAALRVGFKAATGDYVLVQDADLEYDPTEYSVLLNPLIEGKADVVYGSRFLTTKEHRVLFFWHSIGNRLLTLVSNMFTNLNLTDMETGFKAFRREVIQSIKLEQNRFGFEPEVTVKIARMKLRIYEVGISYYGRTYEEGKKINWKDGVIALLCILWYSLKTPRTTYQYSEQASSQAARDGALDHT